MFGLKWFGVAPFVWGKLVTEEVFVKGAGFSRANVVKQKRKGNCRVSRRKQAKPKP
jgi:hypothetical protein